MPEGMWVPYPMHGSEIHRLLTLPAALGAPTDDRLEFPVTDVDVEGAERLVGGAILGRPFAIVHPGSSTPSRRWPSERFAAVADRLVRAGLAVVITGTERERPLADAVLRAMTEAAMSVAGRTTVGELAALVERGQILVANDTGVSHLAAAVGTPSVIVFNGSEIERWAPLDRDRHVPVLSDRPGTPASVDVVASTAVGLLERTAPRSARSASAVS
jgi:ADP-heptose:LPS heptosyltransferase